MNRGESIEAKRAQEALEHIRGWIGKYKESRGGNSAPGLRIKFCGGCNPVMERDVLAGILLQGVAHGALWVGPEEEADLLIILNGCFTACADRPEVHRQGQFYLTISPEIVSAISRREEG